jgi:hypothetical protein
MPKKDVDYSNTIIYKIYCKDDTITDVYVGHTTNFIQRKYAHKTGCNNLNNNLKIYNTIRCNGGWENWDMIQIAKYNCKDSTEARIKEQEHYDELKASLNSCPPYVETKKYLCKICNVNCKGPTEFNKHINCKEQFKQIDNLEINEQNLSEKNDNFVKSKYYCELCNYNCCKIYNWKKHNSSNKHQKMAEKNNVATKKWQTEKGILFFCKNCGKEYSDRTGLWRHKKQCTIQTPNIGDDKDKLIDKLLKQNSKIIKEQNNIKNLILELFKNIKNKSINLDDNTNKV